MAAVKTGGASARRQGFPTRYKALSNPAKAAWLAGEEAEESIRAGQLQKSEVFDEMRRLAECRRRAARQAPTPSLLACYDAGQPYPPQRWDPDRKSERPLVYTAEEAHDEAIDLEVERLHSTLKRVTSAGDRASLRLQIEDAMATKGGQPLLSPQHEGDHLFPAYYFTTSGHYWELHLFALYLIAKNDPVAEWVREQAAAAERSPSAEAHQELANRNAQIIEAKLDSEDLASLQEEIKSFHDGTWQPTDLSARSPRRRRHPE
jgi:hypothetical protein